jgi:hypothetical protein
MLEYFYDFYEGWYIQSFHHGRKHQYTCESSAKYKQCDLGLDLNSSMAKMILENF